MASGRTIILLHTLRRVIISMLANNVRAKVEVEYELPFAMSARSLLSTMNSV